MKKLSSSLSLLFLSVVFVLFSASNARADRAAAGDISYKWISDSTYMLTYTFYRDCGSSTAHPTSVNICYSNACNTDQGKVLLTIKSPSASNGQPVETSWCGPFSTVCTGGTMKGYRKWVYEGRITLPSKCATWRFVASVAARNAGITNITAGTSDNLYSETTLNNIDAPTSSSPTFSLDLIQYMCAGGKQNYNYGGADADGDILTYALVMPSTAADNQTVCAFPPLPSSFSFSGGTTGGTSLATDPFATTGSFNLDAATGIMTFTSDMVAQQAQLTMLITKRRGTKVISTMTRDIQFVVSNTCVAPNVALTYNTATSTGLLWSDLPNDDTAIVCPLFEHKICFNLTSTDPLVEITNVTDNHATFSPTSSTSTMSAYTGEGTNNVSNCFVWTPQIADEGTRFLVIKSEVCKIGSPKVFRLDTIKIEVIKTVDIIPQDTFICLGESTTLCAKSLPDFNWCGTDKGTGACNPSYTGVAGIASPTDSCTSVAPSTTMTYLFTSNSIRPVCQRKENPGLNTNQQEIKVVVVNPRIDAGPDTVICAYPNTILQMNANLINPQSELTYKWRWSLVTGVASKWLNDTSIVNPILTIRESDRLEDIPDSFEFNLTCTPYPDTTCFKVDRVVVYVLKGFYVLTGDTLAGNTGKGYLGRQKGISDTAVCVGDFITLLGWGDPGYPGKEYKWSWTPSAGVSTPTDFIPGTTTITPPGAPIPSGILSFTLTASKSGCRDSAKVINIQVDSIPTVTIGEDRLICLGDTVNLFADIKPSPDDYPFYTYEWSPGGALARADTFYTYFTGFRSEKILFTVKTPAGCEGKDSMLITVQPRSFLTSSNDTAICPGDSVKLTVAGDALLAGVTWKPLMNIDSIHSLTPIVMPPFTTDYIVVGVDSNRCIDSAVVRVTVFPRALIYLEDSVTIYPGEVYQIDPEDNCLYHTWFPPIGLDFPEIANPKASPLLNTSYKVRGVTDAGCVAEDSIFIFVASDSYIDIPNAFIPGRGSENGTFKPVHLGTATLKKFTIYDRWGIKVFEGNNINEGWDGNYNGKPQPLGVYVYLLEAVTANGMPVIKQGNVTLIR